MKNVELASAGINLNNPVVTRAVPNQVSDNQMIEFRDMLNSINFRHGMQAEMLFNTMSKLFDRRTTEDTGLGAFYQFGSCIITDLLAGTTKRLYIADLAAQAIQCSISSYVDMGNINIPSGIDLFFLNPGQIVDIKGYELNIKSIDTLKSIPTVQLNTARLIASWGDGYRIDLTPANLSWAKDQWNLESENPVYFDYKFMPSFPQRNTSSRLATAKFTDRIFACELNDTKYNELFYDSFESCFNFKGDGSFDYIMAYATPASPCEITIDFGVGPQLTFSGLTMAALAVTLAADPIISQLFTVTDAVTQIEFQAVTPNLAPVSCIMTSTTVGATFSLNEQSVFLLGISLDRNHPYSQSQMLVGATRNFYIKGADNTLRITLTPVTDLVNSATNQVMETAK